MNKSIFSNVSVHAQNLYKGVKSILFEDQLLTKSFDSAINGRAGKHQKAYTNYLNMLKGIGDTEGLERAASYKDSILKEGAKKKNIKFGGFKLSDDHSSSINQSIADKLTVNTFGSGKASGAEKSYRNELIKAKASIFGGTAKNMFNDYYVSPLKNGINSMDDLYFKDNRELHKAIGRIGGTTLIGGVAIGSKVSKDKNDRELKENNSRLVNKYNSD